MIGFLLWTSGAAVGAVVTYGALWTKRRAMDADAELMRKWTDAPLTTGPPALPSDSGFPRGARYDPDLPKPVHRRLTDAYVHPRVYGVTAHALAAEVIEPVRTEVLPYRPRHLLTGEETVAILPGDVTGAIERILTEPDAVPDYVEGWHTGIRVVR